MFRNPESRETQRSVMDWKQLDFEIENLRQEGILGYVIMINCQMY